MKVLFLQILISIFFIASCTKQEDIIEVDDDFQLSFSQIYNLKMGATINDTLLWKPTFFEAKIDSSGGYTIQGTQFIRKGLKDTLFHIISLDFVFPVELAIDTMKNGDDFWGFYILDDNIVTTNEKQFTAEPTGIINIDSINLEQKYVSGKFNFIGNFKTLQNVDLKKNISNGTFRFNYK